MMYGFERRAQFYSGLDRQLHPKTRFFAAAALTNRVLAAAARVPLASRLSRSAREILDDLGATLERNNRDLASQLKQELRADSGPDASLQDQRHVATEQALVERYLERRCVAAPNSLRSVMGELDGLLNRQSRWSLCDPLFPAVGGYLEVLQQVRQLLGQPIQFARQAHRVHIGQQLIGWIRASRLSLDPH